MTGPDVAAISARAREVDLGRLLVAAFAALFYALGWLVARTVTAVLTVFLFAAAAAAVGYRDVRPKTTRGKT